MSWTTMTEAATLAACAAGGTAALLAEAALRPGSQVFGRSLVYSRDPREVALTFDDGPNDYATAALLDLFARHEVRATFFMIGGYARQRPEMVRRVHAAGHLVGNHTMTHPWLSWQSPARVEEEMRTCNAVLEDILGARVRFFRPPHGARRPAVFSTARELGLTVVQWNVMGHDWQPIGAEGILKRVRGGMRRAAAVGRSSNVLLHDGSQHSIAENRMDTVAAVRTLLETLPTEGRRFVTVDAWASA